MCSTTPKTKAASPAVKKPSDIKKAPALPAIQPLQKYLSAAYNIEKTNLENVPNVIAGITLVTKQFVISIRAIFKDENNKYDTLYAQIPFDQNDHPPTVPPMYYSGSLVKVAAIYAAMELLAVARMHAKTATFPSPQAFLTSLDGIVDTSAAIQRLKTFGKGLKPDLIKIFQYDASATVQVKFVKKFSDSLKNIFHNEDATVVIDALGYSYINVSMMKGNFFDAGALTGIWLAGDYSKEKSLKSVRIHAGNDIVAGGSAQTINTKEMTRMFYLIHTGQAYPHITDLTERNTAIAGAHAILKSQISWFTRTGSPDDVKITVSIPFTVDCAKVGIGALGPVDNPGAPVYSEGEILVWTGAAQVTAFNTKYKRKLTGEFAVCWQNLYQLEKQGDPLVRLIGSAINDFLIQ
jgi:hypothetical protein